MGLKQSSSGLVSRTPQHRCWADNNNICQATKTALTRKNSHQNNVVFCLHLWNSGSTNVTISIRILYCLASTGGCCNIIDDCSPVRLGCNFYGPYLPEYWEKHWWNTPFSFPIDCTHIQYQLTIVSMVQVSPQVWAWQKLYRWIIWSCVGICPRLRGSEKMEERWRHTHSNRSHRSWRKYTQESLLGKQC